MTSPLRHSEAILGKFSWVSGLLLVAGLAALAALPPSRGVLGAYATSLEGRAASQRHNALRAARAIHGTVLGPGQTFSFNQAVGPWTADCGYVMAPVSFEGELLPAWGGGVCQTSTALYNAALLAGLEIVARHRHMWAPRYVAVGRDAAVAQYDIDLGLRNPYPWPVCIEANLGADSLAFSVLGREAGPMAAVEVQVRAVLSPRKVLQLDDRLPLGEYHVLNRGRPGHRVLVYRHHLRGPKQGKRELVSEDRYPPMNRLISAGR